MILLGILLSLLSAVLLSFGAQLQHSGVRLNQDAAEKFSVSKFFGLFSNKRWVLGLTVLAIASAMHLAGLGLAPVIVVQPVGIVGLVITTLMYARFSHTKISHGLLWSLVLCVVGVSAFVTVAAFVAQEPVVTNKRLWKVLGILAVLLVLAGIVFWRTRRAHSTFLIIVAGGALHGFDAILLKAILSRFASGDLFAWLTLLALVALGIGFSLGTYFVQEAYAVSAPDAVLSGLTVIDPMVAVIVGASVLGEAAGAPLWSLFTFVAAGLLAVVGVVQLTRHRSDLPVAEIV